MFIRCLMFTLATTTVTLTAITHAADAPAQNGAAVTVELTGRRLSVNGQKEVPRQLFGVHATELTPARISEWGVEAVRLIHQKPSRQPSIAGPAGRPELDGLRTIVDCAFDRYQPALVLSRPNDWEQTLVSLAEGYARNAVGRSDAHWLEFWNEPYLNWSVKPGVHYDGDWYDTSRAAEGGPVHDRNTGQPLPDLVWTRGLMAVDADTGQKDYLAWGYAPRNVRGEDGKERPVRAGDTYVFRNRKTMRFVEHWLVRDTTQKSYWAGRHNVALYNKMLVPFARAAKAANPELPVIAGFDFHIYQGGWDAWETCFRPTIDAAWQWIDGVDEHHYGEDTRRTAASYELVAAYGTTRYGKRLRCFNTEAGGMLDPQRPDTPAEPAVTGTNKERASGAFTYMVRDLIYMIGVVPDKAASRFAHEADRTGGEELAFKLLKPLRGQLLETRSSSRDVWSAASANGNQACLVVFNDQAVPVVVDLAIPAADRVEHASVSFEDEKFGLLTQETTAKGKATRVELQPKSAHRFTFELAAPIDAVAEVVQSQYFAAQTRFALGADVPQHAFAIELPQAPSAATIAAAVRATFSFEGKARRIHGRLNGHPIELPLGSGIVDVSVPVEWLQARNTLEILPPPSQKVSIDTLSILVTEASPSPSRSTHR